MHNKASGTSGAPSPRGIVIAAPSSNSGKTVITLALLRALKRSGVAVAAAKTGPDYIDPAFQAAACGASCINLDSWAMDRDQIQTLVARQLADQRDANAFMVCEGVMGLFDGAANGIGSTADLAAMMNWPVVLVVDVKGQSASAAALISGFATFRADTRIAGVILNRVGSDRHKQMIMDACAKHLPDIPVIGAVRRSADLTLPERHLGLVQAGEHRKLDDFLDRAADIIAQDVDLKAFAQLVSSQSSLMTQSTANEPTPMGQSADISPLGQHIAIARDTAFAFAYRHLLDGWARAGATLSFFSPLNDEVPDPTADAIYLPGGYPELFAAELADASQFKAAMRTAAQNGVTIYGECGGYMVLGESLIDANGDRYEMLGLLAVETSFAARKLHLGYRQASLAQATPFGPAGTVVRGHEFHYASTLSENGSPFCHMKNAMGDDLGTAGLMHGTVFGSFFHVISARPEDA
ncbi:cobyrinate a,c-diamide synthase [Thalassospira lucentensis]|uniref:cobyrinate a,c-diamide synthase n=1 Tax=Thalassospira lucentensis TaxID=168935 RepID=UPI00142D4F31|nr:cobyrinate a,c-diamide synthase [Thalassospira lucentensis]NIZ00910.1 cobyrinate a,c-diamide synthase [Thalassospira lucentensis]